MDFSVEVVNLTKEFGDFVAVDNITFSVKKGEIFGFLGPNGAGKSTTIRMLCGILSPSSGSGMVAGYDIVNEQNKIKSSIGYMSQKFSLYGDMTVIENLEFFGSIYGLEGNSLRERIDYVLELTQLFGRKNDRVDFLPGGIKQRLALGSAIIHDPEILFLDEPTSGVDPVMRRNFWDLIYDFSANGRTIFVTTHYLDEAEHCDRIALIIAGKIIACDLPQKLKDDLHHDVYTLHVPDFIKVFERVSQQSFIDEAAIFGSDIHLLCSRGFNLKKELSFFLKNQGITNFRIEKIAPTLEDVLVTHARRLGV
jgi:ABC-2 type transport system ATP-binding protein